MSMYTICVLQQKTICKEAHFSYTTMGHWQMISKCPIMLLSCSMFFLHC